jgi:glycosyltransferase involved in cell wall biosynthesis
MDVVVLSHLRWDFVYQRPQHLMTRAAGRHRVLFIEEPLAADTFGFQMRTDTSGVRVVQPLLPSGTPDPDAESWLRGALTDLVAEWRRSRLILWHYSVMAEPLSRDLEAEVTVFDCMDQLSAFRGAPPTIRAREDALLGRSDLVFTGGRSLWEAKRPLHPSVHCFPSSVDVSHFASARVKQAEPPALASIPHPRLVYAGVIDERIDLDLLHWLADSGAGEVVLIGPVAKIDPADVPCGPHIHALGLRPYAQLPSFFAHADLGLMPFALNEATRFISPTKTPEYLAAGLPVLSTPVDDVISDWGGLAMVHIADRADFIAAARDAVSRPRDLCDVDQRLAELSWDATWEAMDRLIEDVALTTEAA